MIIALPPTDHNHLADALVRDLGFQCQHVDAPLRDLLVALDPYVDSGVSMANRGPTPRLSSKLEQMGGNSDEDRWTRLLNPPRPGAAVDGTAAEVRRLLDVLRSQPRLDPTPISEDDVVVLGVDSATAATASGCVVAIQGRFDDGGIHVVDHWIGPAGVVGEQEAIVNYARELREPKPVEVAPAIVTEPDEDGTYGGHGSGTHVAAIIGGADLDVELRGPGSSD